MEYTLSLSFSFLSLYLPSIRVLFQLTVLQPEFPGGSLPEGSINFPSLSPDIQSVTKHYTHTYIYICYVLTNPSFLRELDRLPKSRIADEDDYK